MNQPNNPLHGITLEQVVTQLVDHYGWEALGERVDIRSFNHDPSIKSSLKFLRKTQWARDKVEALYIRTHFDRPATAVKPKPSKARPKSQPKPTGSTQTSNKKPAQKKAYSVDPWQAARKNNP